MQRDVASGTALQEIGFWVSMEHAVNRLQTKRNGAEVVLTLEVLKAGKRFHATVSFDSDTGEDWEYGSQSSLLCVVTGMGFNDGRQ